MGLIKCFDCGKEVSEKASTCPSCGFPIKKTLKEKEFERKVELQLKQMEEEEKAKKTKKLKNFSEYTPKEKKDAFYGLLLIIGIVLLIWWAMTRDPGDPYHQISALHFSQELVERQLVSPSSADFPSTTFTINEHVKNFGNGIYFIKSYVDAPNHFGVTIRTHFTAKLKKLGTDKWELIDFDILE